MLVECLCEANKIKIGRRFIALEEIDGRMLLVLVQWRRKVVWNRIIVMLLLFKPVIQTFFVFASKVLYFSARIDAKLYSTCFIDKT